MQRIRIDSVTINSCVIASTIIINTFYAVFTTSMGISGITTVFLLAMYIIGIINISMNYTKRHFIDTNKLAKLIILEIFLLFSYILTEFFAKVPTEFDLWNFTFYCFLPVVFLFYEFDTEKVLRYGMYLSLISAIAINSLLIDQGISSRFSQTKLGTIYDLLPCIILAGFHFFYYRKKANIFTKVCYVYYLYMLVRMLLVIVRGAMLTLMFAAVLIYINRPKENQIEIRKLNIKKKLILYLGAVLSLYALLHFNDIIEWLYYTLQSFNINFGVISKFHFYIVSGNITDNREPYYALVWEMFIKSPIWGAGIQTFYAHSYDGASYPHCYVLQFLFEGGLLLAVPLTFISIRELYRVSFLKYKKKDDFVFAACLVISSVVPGLFSMNIWYNRIFWLVLAFGLIKTSKSLFYIRRC